MTNLLLFHVIKKGFLGIRGASSIGCNRKWYKIVEITQWSPVLAIKRSQMRNSWTSFSWVLSLYRTLRDIYIFLVSNRKHLYSGNLFCGNFASLTSVHVCMYRLLKQGKCPRQRPSEIFVTLRFCNCLSIIPNHYDCKICSVSILELDRCQRFDDWKKQKWKFVVKRSRHPHSCLITGRFAS